MLVSEQFNKNNNSITKCIKYTFMLICQHEINLVVYNVFILTIGI
jgi:hypothetical protein